MSFKLIAIRPLKGCSARFLKNLEEDRIYKFYNDYSFLDENDKEVKTGGNKITKIQCKNSVPETLYEKSGLDIQIVRTFICFLLCDCLKKRNFTQYRFC